jgi:hypothetical protein
MRKLAIILLLFSFSAFPIGDAVFLAQLVANTAGQLKELTELAKSTKSMSDEFNQVQTRIQEKIDTAEEIQWRAEEVAMLQELGDVDDLDHLISNLKHLKSTVADTNEYILDVARKKKESLARERKNNFLGKAKVKAGVRRGKSRVNVSGTGGNIGSNAKATAMNTAYTHREVALLNEKALEQNELLNLRYKQELIREERLIKQKKAKEYLYDSFRVKGAK